MRRHNVNENYSDEPPRKKIANISNIQNIRLSPGEIITDVLGKKWKLGNTIGIGGFGEIYLVSDLLNKEVKTDAPYIAKIESHESGPLFVEINCYLRIAKCDMINDWKKEHKLPRLGMPQYVSFGSHSHEGTKYRFLILPHYDKDLEKILQLKCKFNLKTVLTISQQIIDVLEYIHSKGYVHSDIKASNILMNNNQRQKIGVASPKTCVRYYGFNPVRSCRVNKVLRTLRPNCHLRLIQNLEETCTEKLQVEKVDQVYLLDYGLASKYMLLNGEHKKNCVDERKAHAGTLLFCSRDAHKGVQARRSDLECLGYNMIYWLTSNLPWSNEYENAELIHKKKEISMTNVDSFLKQCFTDTYYPPFLFDYFKYLLTLEFEMEPDYKYCKYLFKNALKSYGYNDNSKFDFDNLEGWGKKQKKYKCCSENLKTKKKTSPNIKRIPLHSNLPIKPLLRKKTANNKNIHKLKWSKILLDPKQLVKRKTKKGKLTECHDSLHDNNLSNAELQQLNPTYAMIDIFNKSKERSNYSCGGNSPKYKGDGVTDCINGYTPAMMAVYNRKKEKKELEQNHLVVNKNRNKRTMVTRNKNKLKQLKPVCRNCCTVVKTQVSKSVSAVVKEIPTRKLKSQQLLKRTYSLRG